MPFCVKCGDEITDIAKFCPNCGTRTKEVEITKIVKKKIKKKPQPNFQSSSIQKKLKENKASRAFDPKRDEPGGTNPKFLGKSLIIFIVSSVLWISFILIDETYLKRIMNIEFEGTDGLTVLDWLSFIPFIGILFSGIVLCFSTLTSMSPKLVEEWKEWDINYEIWKNNPNSAPTSNSLPAHNSQLGFFLGIIVVGIGLCIMGAKFVIDGASADNTLLYLLGLGIGTCGTIVLLIVALGIWVYLIDMK